MTDHYLRRGHWHRQYSNRFAEVERRPDGRWDCFNSVTGLFVRTANNWADAKAFLVETRQHYQAVERGII